MGTGFAHRLVCVGCAEDQRVRGDCVAAQASRIAASVESLAMLHYIATIVDFERFAQPVRSTTIAPEGTVPCFFSQLRTSSIESR